MSNKYRNHLDMNKSNGNAMPLKLSQRGNDRAARGRTSPGAGLQWGRQIISRAPNCCRGVEKSQQCHKYFLHINTFASERSVSNMGAPNLLLTPGAI